MEWEAGRARGARRVRVGVLRSGVVLDRRGGALAKMLPPFPAGIGGPVAGGRQYMSWIHLEDLVGCTWRRSTTSVLRRPFNAVAPAGGAQRRVLARPRPRAAPPGGRARSGAALRPLYGEMAAIVTASQNVAPSARRGARFGYRTRSWTRRWSRAQPERPHLDERPAGADAVAGEARERAVPVGVDAVRPMTLFHRPRFRYAARTASRFARSRACDIAARIEHIAS